MPKTIQQIEIIQKPIRIDEHRGLAYWCESCQKVHYAPLPPEVRKGGLFGPELTARKTVIKILTEGNEGNKALRRQERLTDNSTAGNIELTPFVSFVIFCSNKRLSVMHRELWKIMVFSCLLGLFGTASAQSIPLSEVALNESPKTKPHELGYFDLNKDGEDDLLVFYWQGHLTAFIADNGSLPWKQDLSRDWDAYFDKAHDVGKLPRVTWNPARGDWGSYTLLVDRDDDGDFDSGSDFWYQVVDLDQDGDPDIERTDRYVGYGKLCKYNFDLDDDNRNNNMDWSVPGYGDEQASVAVGNYISDRTGNGFFQQVWLHMKETTFVDTRAAWENPIAWYDLDDDGVTELVVRITDTHGRCKGTLAEVEVAFDLDNNSNAARQSSLDFQLSWIGNKSRPYDYSHMIEKFPRMAGLREADYLFGKRLSLRHQTDRMTVPYFDAYKIGTELDDRNWDSVFLLIDEDNDNARWEEMFSPHEAYGYEDHLGDRWESDDDYDGGGQLYLGKFDGRIHLYGADRAEWTIDYRKLYKGSKDRPAEGPEPPEGIKYRLIRYADTDTNGFIDQIIYGEAAYGDPDSFHATHITNLLDFATSENPHPDVCPLFDVKTADPLTSRKVADWDGKKVTGYRIKAYDRLKRLFEQTANQRWQAAWTFYQAAKQADLLSDEDELPLPANAMTVNPSDRAGLLALTDIRTGPGYLDLLAPHQTLWEEYDHGFWLAEKVFADLLDEISPERHDRLRSLYYEGNLLQLAKEFTK